MDYQKKMKEIGRMLSHAEVNEMKFFFSDIIHPSVLENISNSYEMIRELECIGKVGPDKYDDFIELLISLERHDLIKMFNCHQTHAVCFETDFQKKMQEVGKRLSNDDVEEIKFIFSYLIEDSVLKNITNGCQIIKELERIIEFDPEKLKDFIELLKSMGRNDLVEMFNSQQIEFGLYIDQTYGLCNGKKCQQNGHHGNNDGHGNGRKDTQSIIFRNQVFVKEFCKKIGNDWKCLGRALSIDQNELDAIDYTHSSTDIRAYAMLSKFKKWKPEDMINELNNMGRIDLLDEIGRLTDIWKNDVTLEVSDNSAFAKLSGGNLECDTPKQIDQLQCALGLTSIENKINNLYKNGTDKIRTFNANNITIDLGVRDLKEAVFEIKKNQKLLKDEKTVDILFNSCMFIGDIYTSTFYSKFQGNIYTNKTVEKYEEAIDAYETGFNYSEILHNEFEHGRFLHKLITILNKPADYGYENTVRDQVKYSMYFVKYKSSIRDRYEEGMRCLQELDFINAIYFFEKEIKNPQSLEAKGCSLMHVAMAFHFYGKKTNETYNKAVSYYKEAINIFINLGATDITGDVTCCYYYLCKLLSNPSSYGYDNSLKDAFTAAEIFHIKESYIEGNVDRLLTQAEIYACRRFPWINDKTDLDTNKVIDYCKRALLFSNSNIETETKIYYLMTYTYSFLMVAKNYNVYLNAITCCQKALKTFKTRQKCRNQEYAERVVTESMKLAFFPETRGFQDINKNDSKPLIDLIEEIYESKEYKIDHFKEMKDYQMLHGFDPIFNNRVNSLCLAEISVKNGNKSEEYRISFFEEKQIVLTTIKKLKEIENNRNLYHYFFGFIKTFSKSYHAALSVTSGQLALDTESKVLKTSSLIIGLIPLFGEFLKNSMNEIMHYIKSVELKNAAIYLSSLAARSNEFEDMIRDIVVEIIFDNKEEFLTKSFDHKAKNWFDKMNNFYRNMLENIDEAIFVQEFPEDMHKLGYRDAVKIIQKWISNGNIYGGQHGASLLPNDKKELLKKVIFNEVIICQLSKRIF